MKNKLKICFTALLTAFMIYSCSEADKVVDDVFDGVTAGAVLRGDNATLVNTIVLDVTPALFYLDIEEQDNQDGALLESVDVYVTFNDNSTIAGDSGAATTNEVFAMNIPASEFSPGEFGLPVTSISMPLSQLLSLVGLSSDQDIYVNDVWNVRLALNLTDGRTFSDYNTAAVVTGGFFNSPFLYNVTVEGGMDISFENEGTNEINIVPGATNDGYSADVRIDEIEVGLFQTMNIYASYIDNNDSDPDINVDETMVASIDRAAFTNALDDEGEPLISEDTGNQVIETSVALDLATISLGNDINDMSAGDEVELRYVLVNSAGRDISALTPPFVQTIPVVSCPVGPLTDADFGRFVGEYEMEQVSPSIFGYETFGDGNVVELFSQVTDASQEEPGVALGTTQRAFDAEYLFALGFGNPDTYVVEFNCQSATFVDGMAPIDGSTGVWCGNVAGIILGAQVAGGEFDVTNDAEWTLGFTDDVEGECGDPITAAIKFTKQ